MFKQIPYTFVPCLYLQLTRLHCPLSGTGSPLVPLPLSIFHNSPPTLETWTLGGTIIRLSLLRWKLSPQGSVLEAWSLAPPLHFTCSIKHHVNQFPQVLLLCNYLLLRDSILCSNTLCFCLLLSFLSQISRANL